MRNLLSLLDSSALAMDAWAANVRRTPRRSARDISASFTGYSVKHFTQALKNSIVGPSQLHPCPALTFLKDPASLLAGSSPGHCSPFSITPTSITFVNTLSQYLPQAVTMGLREPAGAVHTECSYSSQRSPSGPCPPLQAHPPTPPAQRHPSTFDRPQNRSRSGGFQALGATSDTH